MKHPDKFQILVALDQLVNTIAGGYADETISSRAYRFKVAGHPVLAKVINALFFWQNDHCLEAYMSEKNRSQLPPDLRSAKAMSYKDRLLIEREETENRLTRLRAFIKNPTGLSSDYRALLRSQEKVMTDFLSILNRLIWRLENGG